MRINYVIAAAVAGVLGVGVANAAPTAAQAAAAPVKLWVGGSSAFKGAFGAAIAADLCGGAGNMTIFTSVPTPTVVGAADFNAYSCVQAAGKPQAGQLTTIYYRAEGGSAVGVYPVVNNTSIKYLDLTSCPGGSGGTLFCPVAGTSSANGNNDSWGAGTSNHALEVGFSDLEPGQFIGGNSPIGVYSAAFTGPAKTQTQLNAIPHSTLVQQTFGIVINKTGNLAGVTNLSKSSVANLLAGFYADWNQVPNAGGTGSVTAASTPVIICNREIGSGTRTAADLFFTNDQCNKGGAINAIANVEGAPLAAGYPVQPANNFATSEELACVNSNPGAIGYVGADNVVPSATFPNALNVTLDSVASTNLNTASGQYQFAFEATLNKNNTAIALNPAAPSLVTYITGQLQNISTTAQKISVNALPGFASNAVNFPLQQVGVVYTTPFARGGNSCSPMTEQ